MKNELPLEHCEEYDGAARWCALRGLKGQIGDRLPENMDPNGALFYIQLDPEAFQARVKDFAYELAMNKHQRPDTVKLVARGVVQYPDGKFRCNV